jgi:uncharacterized membrane protein YphA (DoxX/SURF4 family)
MTLFQFEPQTKSAHLFYLRLAVGIFFLTEALQKTGWLSSAEPLLGSLNNYLKRGVHEISQWYLNTVAIPYAEVWARMMFFGELLIGISLIIGLWTRVSLPIAILMVLSFHLANGTLLSWAFFSSAYALLLLSCLVILWRSPATQVGSVEAYLARSKGSAEAAK